MDGDRQLRLRAGFAVAKALGDHETRQLFDQLGHQSGDQIVVALDSDTIGDVLARARRHEKPPAVVAVFWPEEERLQFAGLGSVPMIRAVDSGTSTPESPELHETFRWAESVGASGVGEQRIIEIDVAVPGRTAWEPMMLTVQQARELHAMLGDAITDEHPGRSEEPTRHLRAVGDVLDDQPAADVRDPELTESNRSRYHIEDPPVCERRGCGHFIGRHAYDKPTKTHSDCQTGCGCPAPLYP